PAAPNTPSLHLSQRRRREREVGGTPRPLNALLHLNGNGRKLIRETYFRRRRSEGACLMTIAPGSHSSDREMRSEGPAVDVVAEAVARDFYVVVKQLESRIGLDADPDDTRTAKVRERADASKPHRGRRVTPTDQTHRVGE